MTESQPSEISLFDQAMAQFAESVTKCRQRMANILQRLDESATYKSANYEQNMSQRMGLVLDFFSHPGNYERRAQQLNGSLQDWQNILVQLSVDLDALSEADRLGHLSEVREVIPGFIERIDALEQLVQTIQLHNEDQASIGKNIQTFQQ